MADRVQIYSAAGLPGPFAGDLRSASLYPVRRWLAKGCEAPAGIGIARPNPVKSPLRGAVGRIGGIATEARTCTDLGRPWPYEQQ